MNKFFVFLFIFFIAGVLSLIVFNSVSAKDVPPDAFEHLMANDHDVFLINTHTPYIGEIEGTDLIIEDWQNVVNYKDKLPDDKKKPILVYCRSGSMSSSASEQLIELGYKNIYNLEGGMIAWEASGRSLIKN